MTCKTCKCCCKMWLSGFFATAFVMHTIRALLHFPLQIGTWAVPVSASAGIAAVTGILSLALWKAGCGSCGCAAK